MNEVQINCSLCESTDIAKLLTKPLFFRKKDEKSSGKLTKKYIEENKEVLEELRKEAQKDYDELDGPRHEGHLQRMEKLDEAQGETEEERHPKEK